MLKALSLQSPITKISTSEMELKYVLRVVNSGVVTEKGAIDFCQNHTHIHRVYVKATIESFIQTIVLYLSPDYKVKFDDFNSFLSYRKIQSR